MEIPDDVAQTLLSVLESYMCSFGMEYPDLFKECDKMKKAYEALAPKGETMSKAEEKKDKIEEATPKSTIEKLHRKTRKFSASKAAHHRDMPGKVVPKKTANNDPTRGGNRVNEEDLAVLFFMKDNVAKRGDALKEAVSNFKYKDILNMYIKHMIAINMGGWRLEDGHFVNESGHIAGTGNWTLNEGSLVSKNGSKPDFNTDWLFEVKEYSDAQGKVE
jgi:hypothetical protein